MTNTITNLTKTETSLLKAIAKYCEKYNVYDCYIDLCDAVESFYINDFNAIVEKGFIDYKRKLPEISRKGFYVALTNKGIDFINN
jgi:hypothetical protein